MFAFDERIKRSLHAYKRSTRNVKDAIDPSGSATTEVVGGGVFAPAPEESLVFREEVKERQEYKKLADGKFIKDKLVLESAWKLDLQQIGGKWVPSKATCSSHRGKVEIRFDWKSVNPPTQQLDLSFERAIAEVAKPIRAN